MNGKNSEANQGRLLIPHLAENGRDEQREAEDEDAERSDGREHRFVVNTVGRI